MVRIQIFITTFILTSIFCLCSVVAEAQITISGSVFDGNGSPLPTVNVLLLQPADSSVVKGAVNAGIQKRVAPGRGTLQLSADDLFSTSLWKYSTSVPAANLDTSGIYDFNNRNVKLTFTWNFGNSNINSVDISSGSEEEQGRVTN